MKIICWLKGLLRSFPFDGYQVSGHSHVEKEVHKNVTVFVTECETCGKTEITWSKR